MILRLSQKLAKKIKVALNRRAPRPTRNPFADWSAHLFTADRSPVHHPHQHPIALFDADAGERDHGRLRWVHRRRPDLHTRFHGRRTAWSSFSGSLSAPASEAVVFSKAPESVGDRLDERPGLPGKTPTGWNVKMPLLEVSSGLNEVPLKALGYKNPREVLGRMMVGPRRRIRGRRKRSFVQPLPYRSAEG